MTDRANRTGGVARDETARDEVSVDGERAFVIDSEVTEPGVYEEGTQLYGYYIEHDGTTIVAAANDGVGDEADSSSGVTSSTR